MSDDIDLTNITPEHLSTALNNMKMRDKLSAYKKIEEELGIDLMTLFESDYAGNECEMELDKYDDEGTPIYFDGDTFYGHYSTDGFLNLIKDMISFYRHCLRELKGE